MKRFLARSFLTTLLASLFLATGTVFTLSFAQGISVNFLSSYRTNVFFEGAAEIVSYDPDTSRLYVVNANAVTVDILDISNIINPSLVDTIDMTQFGGVANSVAVKDGVVAVAIEADVKQESGKVVFMTTEGNVISEVSVGALPDMLTFTPDGSKVVVANEGEPNDDYTVDPEGTVSIIDVSGGVEDLTQDHVTHVGFDAFNRIGDALRTQIRIFGLNASVAQDLEPEYVAISPDSTTAYVTLQENNAVAEIDLGLGIVTGLNALGYKDHSLVGNEMDASNEDGGINLQNWPALGMYQPDAIVSYEVDGELYFITANEGDARDYDGYSEETRVADLTLDPRRFPNAEELQAADQLGRLKTTTVNADTDGDGDVDRIYSYGARSFTIWDKDFNVVYDSGSELERITAEALPTAFNSNGGVDSFDSRSDDKGPEPEGIALGVIEGETYAFIALERVGGVAVYNVSDPAAPEFVQYVNNRNVDLAVEDPEAGDIGPEGILFIPADDSPLGIPLLVVSNEISGSTTLYGVAALR